MARITREEVERVAALARLSLSEEEVRRMASELDTILEYVEELGRVDTDGVEATCHVLPLDTPMREDRAEPALDPELALANAPQRDGSAFVVPKVIEGEEEG
jgi:aspartyl-tRNA(Asn)/glutamyl-tRNA(Gln) amidotransferase subunit C